MRRISISILTTVVVMLMMLNSCSGTSIDLPVQQEQEQEHNYEHEQETPDDQGPGEPDTPEFRKGIDLSVIVSSTPLGLFPSDIDDVVEIPFTVFPLVDSIKCEVVVSVPGVVSTELVMSEGNSGGVVRVTTVGELTDLFLSIRITEVGRYVIRNWTESDRIKLEPYRFYLSHYERETQPSGTNHGEFEVITNVGFDPVVDEDCSDWLSIVGVEDDFWVVMDIKENTTDKVREGHIRVWDRGHHVYETFTVIQKRPSVYDNDGDGILIEVEDMIDGGDHHTIY